MVGSETSPNRASKIVVPASGACHPFARLVFYEMRRCAVTYDDLEWKSGVLRSTFKAWKTRTRPGLESIEAALGALGWDVLPVPRIQTIAPALRADLMALACKHHLQECPVVELVAACMGSGWRWLLEERQRRDKNRKDERKSVG